MFRINKKVLVIAGLAILLAVTGVLNWKFAADKKARQQAEGNGSGTEQTVQLCRFPHGARKSAHSGAYEHRQYNQQ